MKSRRSLLALALLLLVALPGAAELTKYKDWSKSPELVYLATDDEKKAWKNVKTDEEAEKFVALFWAKRNPDLKNPANEFKMLFEARVAKADELFKLGTKRGALTERGKLLILVGPPKSMAQKAESSGSQPYASSTGGYLATSGGGTTITYQFLYEQPQLPKWADVQSLDAKFQVDTSAQTEHLIDMGPVKRLENMAVAKAMVHPELTQVKTRAEVEAEAKAAGEAAAEAAKGPTLTPAIRQALEAATPSEGLTLFPLAYANSATRLMVQLFVPAAKAPVAGTSAPDLKLAMLVRVKSGDAFSDAVRKEEPALLEKTKGDLFCDRALAVPAGEYDVAAGLFDAAGAPVVTSRGSITLPELPSGFALSPLFLAYNDYEAPAAKPEDPFIFFQRKFVGKGGAKLDPKTDGLSWVVRVYNPSIDASRKINLKKDVWVIRKGGAKIPVPQGPPEPIAVPENAPADQKGVVLDLAGGIVEADLGAYFAPQDSVRIEITDMGSAAEPKPKVTASADFALAMPEKPAAPPAPAPAPKKK